MSEKAFFAETQKFFPATAICVEFQPHRPVKQAIITHLHNAIYREQIRKPWVAKKGIYPLTYSVANKKKKMS